MNLLADINEFTGVEVDRVLGMFSRRKLFLWESRKIKPLV